MFAYYIFAGTIHTAAVQISCKLFVRLP